MGGQACILYGAAEFTRDSDFAVSADEANLQRLRAALSELKATPVYVPALGQEVLRRGHACHFRCRAPGVENWRIDLMARMRGCAEFADLWERRNEVRLPGQGTTAALAIPDLVTAKKTQRDKDWPMIARLVAADYLNSGPRPARGRIEFWLMQARTPELLLHLVRRFRGTARRLASRRAAIAAALRGDIPQIDERLYREQQQEREADRAYWTPLRLELRRWRAARRGQRR
jgi:hypothetical protein